MTFHRRNALGQFQNCFSVGVSELEEIFPQMLAPHLGQESFFSINGYYRPGYKRSELVPQLYMPLRRNDSLRYLNAVFLDLDCYKCGLSTGQAIGWLIDAQDEGTLPPASMLTRSGRGVWAFWFLRDPERPEEPQGAWPEHNATFYRLQRRLHDIAASVGSDAKARAGAQITRVPGSLHLKAGVNVAYWIQADATGKGFTYTLAELCAHLDVDPEHLHPEIKKTIDPRYRELGRRGYVALNDKRLRNLLHLRDMRDGFQQGCRNHALFLLSGLLKRVDSMAEAEQAALVREVGRTCRPPLSEAEIDAAWTNGRRDFHKISEHTFADWLHVTPEEAAQLDRSFPEKKYRPEHLIQIETVSRKERGRHRRMLLGDLTVNGVPPLRTLQNKLLEYGIEAAPSTIRSDLAALGIPNPRTRTDQASDQLELLERVA